MSQLFVDMDGVLADFNRHHTTVFGRPPEAREVDWSAVRGVKNFFLDIPPMADLDTLWQHIAGYNPIVLTGVPASVAEAPDNKRAWARKYLGGNVEVRCCRSREKCRHASPGDVLVDDWEKYRDLWLGSGGRWITHRDANRTIEALGALRL